MAKLDAKPLTYWMEGPGLKTVRRLETDERYTAAQAARDESVSNDAIYKAMQRRREKGIGGIFASKKNRGRPLLKNPPAQSRAAQKITEDQLAKLGANFLKTAQEQVTAANTRADAAESRAETAERRLSELERILISLGAEAQQRAAALKKVTAQSKDVYKQD